MKSNDHEKNLYVKGQFLQEFGHIPPFPVVRFGRQRQFDDSIDTASFNSGHDSRAFGGDILFNSTSKLAINGGTVMNSFRFFTGNERKGELELNGANAVNGSSVRVWDPAGLLLDVNSAQNKTGVIAQVDQDALLTIEVADPGAGEEL